MPTMLWAIFVVMAWLVPLSVPGAVTKPLADIVYSARYYKPGKEVSQYHLWRINPDGSGRVQVTSSIKAADHSPLWLADGHTILFVREESGSNRFCTVSESGGVVTTFAPSPGGQMFIRRFSLDRRLLLFSVEDKIQNLQLLDVASKSCRPIGLGWEAALSPDGQMLYSSDRTEGKPSLILNLASGKQTRLPDNLMAAAWLDDNLIVAELSIKDHDQPRLCLVRANGTIEREIPIPFTWGDDLSLFADDLFPIPGDRDSILYGRHAGDSSGGPAHQFYRVNVKTGKTTLLANGRDVAWSPDKRSFCTGEGRDLAPFSDKHQVWVSPLHIVSLEDGSRRTIVQGLVSVGGFDWRPAGPAKKTVAEER